MANNKVVFGNEIIMDLTEDTVTEDKVLEGETFHDRSGVLRSGSLVIPVQDVEVNGKSVVDENGIAEVVVPVSGDVSTTDSFESYTGGKVKSVQMELSPIQDLHGYSEPWVGGSRKNKLPLVLADIKANNTAGTWSGNVYSYNGSTITVNTDESGNVTSIDVANTPSTAIALNLFYASGTFPFDTNSTYILNGCPSGGAGTSNYKLDIIYEKNGINNVLATDTGSGASANFNALVGAVSMTCRIVIYTNASLPKTFYPMIRLSTETDPTFEPYENKCPISGHTQAKLEQRGKNLFNPNSYESFDITGGGVIRYGHEFDSGSYTLINNGTNTTGYFYRIVAKDYSSYGTSIQIVNNTSVNVDVDDVHFLRVFSASWDDTADNIAVVGGINESFEPYQGKDYVINLGGTYYWLRGDVVSGKWYVIGEKIAINTSTLVNIAKSSLTSIDIYLLRIPATYKLSENTLLSGYKFQTEHNVNEIGKAWWGTSDVQIRIGFATYGTTTLDDFKTWLDSANIDGFFEYVTPIELDLTPQQIESFLGENNFSAPIDQQEIIEIIARNIAEFNEVIDDENISDEFTYSSEKIEDRLDDFVDKDAVEEKSATDEFTTINGGLLSECKVSLSPNQDLHGYDSPWVGGAGKNKLGYMCSREANGVNFTYDQTTGAVRITGTATAQAIQDFGTNYANYSKIDAGTYKVTGATDGYIGKMQVWGVNNSGTEITSTIDVTTDNTEITMPEQGYIFARYVIYNTRTVDAVFYPMIRLSSVVDDSFAPYSNICPISGHTQVSVEVGTNKLNPDSIVQGNLTSSVVSVRCSTRGNLTIPISVGQTITVSRQSSTINFALAVTDSSMSVLFDSGWQSGSYTYVSTYDGYVELVFSKQDGTDITPSNVKSANFMVEFGSTPTPYVPYTNGSYSLTVSLSNTYYSGTLDVVSGILTVDKKGITIVGNTLAWYKSSSPLLKAGRAGYYSSGNSFDGCAWSGGDDNPNNVIIQFNCAESGLSALQAAPMETFNIGIGTSMGYTDIWVNVPDSIATVENFKTYLDSNPIQVIYPLATPLTIQLSPTMVKALAGENHLSAPLDGQEITESKYRELFTWNEVEEIAQSIADSKIDNRNVSSETAFSSYFVENRYAKKIWDVPVLTPWYQKSSGATEVTFNNQFIFNDYQTSCELIQIGSGPRVGISNVSISSGSVTFTFDAPLTATTRFVCSIMNFY